MVEVESGRCKFSDHGRLQISGCLAERRKCFLEDPDWISISRTAPGRDSFWTLLDIATRLPGVTQLADESLRGQDASAILNSATMLRTLLNDLDEFAAYSGPHSVDFNGELESSYSTTCASPFPDANQAYTFSCWRSANLYCSWTSICLFARLELRRLIHDSQLIIHAQYLDEIEADIDRDIDNLCWAIPSQIGEKPHSMGIICSLPALTTVCTLLEARGRALEAQWYRAMLQGWQSEGFR